MHLVGLSQSWKANIDFLFGGEDQMPHPKLEAITVVGNTPAYRGSLLMVAKGFNVTDAGNRIPDFQFVVASKATDVTPDNVLSTQISYTDMAYVK